MPPKRSTLSHIDPHSNAGGKLRPSSRLPSAAHGASLLNNARVAKLAPRGDIYDIPVSPEKRVTSPETDAPPKKRKRKHTQETAFNVDSPSVEEPAIEPKSIEGSPVVPQSIETSSVETHPIEPLSVEAVQLAIRSTPTSRPTGSKRRSILKSASSRVPEFVLAELAGASANVTPEEAPAAADVEEQSSLRDPPQEDRDELEDEAEQEHNTAEREDEGDQGYRVPEQENEDEQDEDEQDEDEQDEDEQQDSAAKQLSNKYASGNEPLNRQLLGIPPTFEGIFGFLDLERRPGACQTNVGAQLKRLCKNSRIAIIEMDGEPVETLTDTTNGILEALSEFDARVSEDERANFKCDAYAYIFRALMTYLEALYMALCDGHSEPPMSLTVLRLLQPMTCGILSFKDTIANWKVKIAQRYRGDHLIRNVDEKLIVPLRQLEKELHGYLTELERNERNDETYQALVQERELRLQEEERQQQAAAAQAARRKRWQDLHVVRQRCEPEFSKRQKLFLVKLPDLVERDSNGSEFERIPLFRPREVPPPRGAASGAQEKEWTVRQEVALLDALQRFAGPSVFEKTFKQHCCRGGVLRDFTVSDITAKAAWFRTAYIRMSQETGEEMPTWAKSIPVLP